MSPTTFRKGHGSPSKKVHKELPGICFFAWKGGWDSLKKNHSPQDPIELIRSRELTYPTKREKESHLHSRAFFKGDMFVARRVYLSTNLP